MSEKLLLVGEPHICPQVAYVMDWQDYTMVERLDNQNVGKYQDYKIVICALKRYSKRYVLVRLRNILYLDDICRELDQQDNWSITDYIATTMPNSWIKKIFETDYFIAWY